MTLRALTVLLILFPFSIQAQIVTEVERITFSEEESPIPTFNKDERHFTFLNETNNQLLFITGQQFWRLNLSTNQWQKITDITIPDYLTDAFLDSLNHQLVFVSAGVGEVHTLDLTTDEYILKRVDQSFRHLNQFGSTKFFDNRTGEIYAFGGYGFWYFKNFITYFDKDLAEWNLISLNNEEKVPNERAGALGVYWEQTNKFFTVGGYGIPGGRQKESGVNTSDFRDFWAFDFSNNTWEDYGQINSDLDFSSDKPVNSGNSNPSNLNAINNQNGFWFFPVLNPNTQLRNKFFVADLNQGQIASFNIDQHLNSALDDMFALFWQKESNSLLAVGYTKRSQSQSHPVSIFKISLTDSASIANYIEQNNLIEDAPSVTITSFIDLNENNFWIGIIMGFSISSLLLLFLYRVMGKKSQPNLKNSKPVLKVKGLDSNEPEIAFDSKVLNHQLGEKHITLLSLLIKSKIEGTPYLSSDVVDEKIWGYKINQDYLRKERSTKIRDINKLVKLSQTPISKLIIKRKSPEDRRRSEYGISPEIEVKVEK